jgi:penicillin-binding protein 2
VRSKIVIAIIFLLFSILIYRVYDLSVLSYNKYNELANKNKEKIIPITPIRGIIFDRNDNPIAYNELRFNLALSPHLKNKQLMEKVKFLKSLLPDINETKLIKIYKMYNSPYNHNPITLVEYLDEKSIYKIEPFLSIDDNFFIMPSYLRKYPYKDVLSNVLGYVSRANINDIKKNRVVSLTQISGKRGIEKYYDNILQGEAGKKKVIVNARNIILKTLYVKKPLSHNLTLSIDTKLQKFIYNLLKKENKKGAVVVMKLNGEILALVSYPSYDNNLFVKGISANMWNKLLFNIYHPLLNKPKRSLSTRFYCKAG